MLRLASSPKFSSNIAEKPSSLNWPSFHQAGEELGFPQVAFYNEPPCQRITNIAAIIFVSERQHFTFNACQDVWVMQFLGRYSLDCICVYHL